MDKTLYLSQLYINSCKEITGSKENYLKLLDCVSRFYKYSFDNNVLIYLQRPNAVMLAEHNIWFNKLKRYINKGTKGLAVLDMSNPKATLKFLFEISDTNGSAESYNQAINSVWQLEEQYYKRLNEILSEKFSIKSKSIDDCIIKAIDITVEKRIRNIVNDLKITDKESILYNVPLEAVKEEYLKLIKDSIKYVVFKRSGLNIENNNLQFENLNNYGTLNLFRTMGNITMNTSRNMLADISKGINQIKEERIRNEAGEKNIPALFISENNNIPINNSLDDYKGDTGYTIDEETELKQERETAQEYKQKEIEITDNVNSADFLQQQENHNINNQIEDSDKTNKKNDNETGYTNYVFSREHNLYNYGAKGKTQNNISAIKILKKLESENRQANEKEQIILARYVGWGGLANALTENKNGWVKEYEELKSILTEEEFASAVSSTLTAYYTDQKLIEYIYKALDNFGFKSGKILDPAMGTGNFFSVIPDSMKSSNLYGIELDSITGRIAKQLYPNANIQIKGFEDTIFENNTFDVSIGNIPFNRLQVNDLEYNKYKLFIHEYFTAKMIDKTHSGGITVIISTKGLMDKSNINARKYIAQRAELIGAIRLPNNAFKQISGTEVTADILFFQKREKEIVPDVNNTSWLTIENNENGIPLNSYFINHPEMILGEMIFDKSMYANETTTACKPFEDKDLYVLLDNAVSSLKAEYKEAANLKHDKKENTKVIPADPNVKNYSYTEVNGDIYYRENSIMSLCSFDGVKKERVKGLIAINNVLKDIISFQSEPYNMVKYQGNEYEKEFNKKLNLLNKVYDSFVSKYGFINDKYNCSLFRQDSSMPLLRSIEQEIEGYTKDNKKVYKKEAVFYKPTIRPFITPKSALSAEEALKISLNIKGNLDLDYMSELYKKSKDEIISELDGQIYQNPEKYNNKPYEGWETADEYLSGYVKDKLFMAKMAAEENPELFSKNVEALEKVQPVSVKAGEIGFELGSEWIPVEYYNTFMKELFDSPYYIKINYSQFTNTYYISDKKHDNSLIVINRYGTKDKNAYEILECSLNKKPADVREKKKYIDKNGEEKERYVINKDKTIEVREKQAQIQLEFENWLFRDEVRTAEIVKLYNDLYNNLVPRTYNGDFLTLPDMNSEIALRDYQKEAIAQALYSNKNELIAHEVGLGKTYTAITICHEAKRLGLFSKPLIAVPNGIVEQWAAAYMKLYPTADILVVTKKDFEKNNRKRFVSRIAMTNFEAVIIAHSTFELIKISAERQKEVIKKDIDLITEYIKEEKMKDNKSWTLKQMQIAKKNLEYRYERLMNEEKKDDVINFDELGIDMLIVDEAHLYKNLYNVTKLRNVAGINTSNSQRAMDMYLKCQLLNKRNGDKGIIYLTGTPVSNSMSEIFIMQKTLQPSILERNRLINFDAWASMYGKITSSMELKPEGSGYQMKTRFSKFRNLPELMNMFRQIANIKTAEIADIPRPELYTGKREVIKLPITPNQKRKMIEFAERAELIRLGNVESWEDNFLKLTHEAKLNAIDPKILDNSLERDFNTKLYKCAERAAQIYNETSTEKLTQIIFCDSGTPKGNDEYSFYSEIKNTLKKLNVNEKEIAFIHDYNTDKQKEDLYSKVRNGEIRILIGSTAKMGVGVNIQDRLIALHHLDIPWRPSDLVQTLRKTKTA